MPLFKCREKDPVFGQSVEELLDNKICIQGEKKLVPIEIQQFVTYLRERNAIQFKELFINNSDSKDKAKLVKKINKAGNVDLKNIHDLHLVISVFMDFLKRMPGRIISKDMFNYFPFIEDEGQKKDVKKVKKLIKKLPPQRFETLKYLILFFSGKVGNASSGIKIDSKDIIVLAPVIASAIVETSNDYTLSSKIYKNGNIINFVQDSNNSLDNVKKRENLIKVLMMNYTKIFTKDKKKPKKFKYDPIKFIDEDYGAKYISRSVYDSPTSSPRLHVRISSKQYSSPSSPVQESYDSFSNKNEFNSMLNTQNQEINYEYDTLYSNKNNFDIKNINCKLIGDKIHLSFTVMTHDTGSQDYKLEIPSSGTGMASIRNTSLDGNDSTTQLFRVTSFTDKSNDSTLDDPKNIELKLNLPVFPEANKKFKNSDSFLNIYYPENSNNKSNKHSIVVQIDESVISELQLFLKATRRYLYDLQSFPSSQIKDLFKFAKQRYKLIKDVLADAPYINLEPIMSSPLFGSNKCFVSYEGLNNLSLAQKILMEYDIFKKNNNIKEFIFQKTPEQCKAEKELLYKQLIILKDNITTENDRHILHELNKIYNNIRANLKKS